MLLCITFVSTKVSADTTTPLENIQYPSIPIAEIRFIEFSGYENDYLSVSFNGAYNVGSTFDTYLFKNNNLNNVDIYLGLQNNSNYFTLSTIDREFTNNSSFNDLGQCEFVYLRYENVYLNRQKNETQWHVYPYGISGDYICDYYEYDETINGFVIKRSTGYLEPTTNPFDYFYTEYETFGLLGVANLEIYCTDYQTNNVDFMINIPSTELVSLQNDIGFFFVDYDDINYLIPMFDTTWLYVSVGSFLFSPIFGVVSLGDIVLILISFSLVLILLKYMAGG